jgi:transposase-like protein
MQRIYSVSLTPEQYQATEAHLQVVPESTCPKCGGAGPLHRHGYYGRGVTNQLGKILVLLIARFLCQVCRKTVSYLPDFALSYRLVQAPTVQAFLAGDTPTPAVQTWWTVLLSYRRRMAAFAPTVLRTVGPGLGVPPPAAPPLWPWLKKACGSLAAATRQLVADFQLTLFHRYQCHQGQGG